jgi:crossover junction endonuclease EME1
MMKAVEVIDLLSSPEPPSRKPKPLVKASTEWFCIPDEDAPIIRKPIQKSDHMGNRPALNLNPNPIGVRKLTGSTASGLQEISPVAAGSSKGKDKGKARGKENFFSSSYDFDRTVGLNDPFGSVLEPATKRRRLTPEPVSLRNTYSSLQKGKGIARSLSDIAATSRNATMSTATAAGLRGFKTSIVEDDPILFSSSPDAFRIARDRKEKVRRMKEREIDDDDNEPFDLHESRRNAASSTTQLEYGDRSSSDLDLPDVGTIASQASNFSSLSRADSKKTLAAYESEKIARQKKREKVRKTQEKLELKEAEKERRRVAREEKKKDKEMAADLAKVNTLRIDKKVSTPQMIVDLPTDLDARLVGQVRQFLEPLEVECKEWNNPIPNVVKWRRKVDSVYNEELGHWEPVPKQIKSEKHVMCFMTAKEFVDLTMADEGRDLDAHFLRMKARFDECSILYLVEGLTAWMRKNRNVKNRQFTEAVRSQMSRELEEPSNQKGIKKKQQEYVDEDMIEDSLLRLQVIHGAQIHHTAATVDTAQWIMIFTQHISTTPYR